MAAFRDEWKDDEQLRADLDNYVRNNMTRSAVLQSIERDYASYNWSLATLDRRLRYFGLSYTNHDTSLDEMNVAIHKELNGAGKLLGYRAMNDKLRVKHNVKVPRHLVHNAMAELEPERLEGRSLKKKGKKNKINLTSYGPLWLGSLDGHDKLCGYQSSTLHLEYMDAWIHLQERLSFCFCHTQIQV